MSSGINTMLSKRTIELGSGEKGSLFTPFSFPRKWDESLHNTSKVSQQFIICIKFKNDHPDTDQ